MGRLDDEDRGGEYARGAKDSCGRADADMAQPGRGYDRGAGIGSWHGDDAAACSGDVIRVRIGRTQSVDVYVNVM